VARVDPADPRPAFRQIADQLRDRIFGGAVPPGGPLPSETELLTEFGASRSTVRHSIEVLKSEGLIETRQGRRAFVRMSHPCVLRLAPERFARRHRQAGTTPFTVDVGTDRAARLEVQQFARTAASAEVASRLGLSEGAEVLTRHFRFFVDERPVQLSTSYLPYTLVNESPIEDPGREPWPGGTIAQLETVGVRVTTVMEEVSARLPLPAEARDLELKAGTPVFLVARTMFAADTPVTVSDLVMAADQYVLCYRFPVD
jgi:GntR family transcriptional regulator